MKNNKIRNHISSIAGDMWSFILTVIIFLVVFISNIKTTSLEFNEFLIFVGGTTVLLLFVFTIFFIKWLKTTIEVTSKTIIIDRKTILRKTTNINIKDISTIDISQNIIQKVFKTAKIQLDINSTVTAEENDMKIILKYEEAIQFQKNIIKLMNKKASEKDYKKIELEKYNYKYSFSSIFKHTIFSLNIFVLILLIITNVPILFTKQENLEIILFVLIPIIFSILSSLFKFYNFKILKDDDKINISYGFFSRKKISMPYSKISGLKITQPILARIFNLYSVELINIGYAENETISLLLPLSNKKDISEKLAFLFPNIKLNFNNYRQSKAAPIGYFIDNLIWIIITLVMAFFINYIFGLFIVLIWLINITLSYMTKSFYYNDNFLYITNGIYNKSIVVCETKNIQNIILKENIFIKKYNLCKMNIVLNSNMINSNHETGYFNKIFFDKIIKEYK